jgi:vancomycin permeability regulator SanA
MEPKAQKIANPLRSKILFAVLLFALWFVMHSAVIVYQGLHPFSGNADIAIILGNRVYADSSLSAWLQGRVDKAAQLYKSGRVHKIFASGGQGEDGVAEGDAMKAYLLKKGIPESDIMADNAGQNTYLTARDFMMLDSIHHYSSAIVVTSYYHISRTCYIIKKMGFKNLHAVASERYFAADAYGIVREFFAFYKYLIWY